MLRDATIELETERDDCFKGEIKWRNDPGCFCVVSKDGNWIGLPRENLDGFLLQPPIISTKPLFLS